MSKKSELLRNENFLRAVMIYKNRPTVVKTIKTAISYDRESNRLVRQTRDAYIAECYDMLNTARSTQMAIADKDYTIVAKSANLHADTAEKLDRIIERDFKMKDTLWNRLGEAAGGTAEFVSDFIIKSPYTALSKKLGCGISRIFGAS